MRFGDYSLTGPRRASQHLFLLPLLAIAALLPTTVAANPTRYDIAAAGLRASPRGFYGQDVSYSAPFAVGLDPLCILAGLAFLAFLVQTLYLALHKPIGMGAIVSAGPLAERRTSIADSDAERRVRTALSRYEDLQSATSDPEERTLSVDRSDWQKSPLVALMSLTRAAWQSPECDGGILCRLWFLARMLVGPAFWPGGIASVSR